MAAGGAGECWEGAGAAADDGRGTRGTSTGANRGP